MGADSERHLNGRETAIQINEGETRGGAGEGGGFVSRTGNKVLINPLWGCLERFSQVLWVNH